jgi:peptide/nickel transport system substrate-binding protein
MERSGFVGTMRFNWLLPPFDNVKMRQAVLQVVNQSDYMAAMAGDPENWRTCYSVYACLGYEETRGSEALSGPRDYDRAKKLVAEAGYHGEPVVLLDPADIPQLHAEAAVTAASVPTDQAGRRVAIVMIRADRSRPWVGATC